MSVEPIDRDLLADEARALVDSIRIDITDVGERIATAYLGRAWIALGYADWDALCDAEFEGARLRVPREVRVELVQSLSAAGLSTRSAAKALGVSKDTVARDLSGVSSETPDRAPVVGQDGKRYASTQPPRAAVTHSTTEKTVEEFIADRETGEVLSVEDWQRQEQNASLDADLEQQLANTDDRFLLNLARAISSCNGLLALSPARAAETCPPGSDDHAALTGFLTRMSAWIADVNAAHAPTLRRIK